MTIIELEAATSTAFQVNTTPEGRGEDSSRCKSFDRKNIFSVEINADRISIMNIVKKVIIKIFSLRNSLK